MGRKAAVGKNTGAQCSEFHRSNIRFYSGSERLSQRAASKNPRVWVRKKTERKIKYRQQRAKTDLEGGVEKEAVQALGARGCSSGLSAGRWLKPPGLSPRLGASPSAAPARGRAAPRLGHCSPRPRHSRCSCSFRDPHSSSLRRTRPSRRCSAAGTQRPPGPASSGPARSSRYTATKQKAALKWLRAGPVEAIVPPLGDRGGAAAEPGWAGRDRKSVV